MCRRAVQPAVIVSGIAQHASEVATGLSCIQTDTVAAAEAGGVGCGVIVVLSNAATWVYNACWLAGDVIFKCHMEAPRFVMTASGVCDGDGLDGNRWVADAQEVAA